MENDWMPASFEDKLPKGRTKEEIVAVSMVAQFALKSMPPERMQALNWTPEELALIHTMMQWVLGVPNETYDELVTFAKKHLAPDWRGAHAIATKGKSMGVSK